MNELQVFTNPQFGKIRTIDENGKPLFCGSDIAKVLGYANAPDALNRHCRYIVKHDTATAQGNIARMAFISEGDVYRLIAHSKLPAAEQFECWVFDEVLPSIRKTGSYALNDKKVAAEAKLNNSRARLNNSLARKAAEWLKIAEYTTPTYRQICASNASAVLNGGEAVIPLPPAERKTYSAEEIGAKLGISANMVGRLANANGLKTSEYGMMVWDKKKHCAGQTEAWRYYDTVIPVLRRLLTETA